MLNTRVFAFGILANKDSVDVVVGGFVAGYAFARADIGEEVECAAECKVEGDMTFAYWCLEKSVLTVVCEFGIYMYR